MHSLFKLVKSVQIDTLVDKGFLIYELKIRMALGVSFIYGNQIGCMLWKFKKLLCTFTISITSNLCIYIYILLNIFSGVNKQYSLILRVFSQTRSFVHWYKMQGRRQTALWLKSVYQGYNLMLHFITTQKKNLWGQGQNICFLTLNLLLSLVSASDKVLTKV